MTDITNWHAAIQFHETTESDWTRRKRLVIPINQYQMGHIVDAMWLLRKAGAVNGDWYGETLDIIAVAMKFAGIKTVMSNAGRTFTQEEVEKRLTTYKDPNDQTKTV